MAGKLGPNALDLSPEEFRTLLEGRRGTLKAFLLDQDRIARIGNMHVRDAAARIWTGSAGSNIRPPCRRLVAGKQLGQLELAAAPL